MKPYPFTPERPFDLDEYLDRQLSRDGVTVTTLTPRQIASACRPAQDFHGEPEPTHFAGLHTEPQFRGWAVRLNDRIERWMDRIDWPRIDIWLGTIGGFVITGVALYFLYILADAWLQGRLNLGAN